MTTPRWKQLFDSVEQQAGPRLSEALANPDVIEAIALGVAVQKRASDDLAKFVRRGLHMFNMPAGTDVQQVSKQIAGLEREIRQLNRRLDELS